ncbi:uncharacterized protein LOC125901628 isoform X3 [Epinephelus fuscoguttatus]|uniref:uncharacterized protein LOC125901628 isoform X3 n=1 Tax=Epinephelus fuscoguttatus TaxID=293821 RepID=UPI0020D1A867|nr:uncharacterized protein LOC125901628 isoform X3 [Epinephelus fuscoguttatus]
MSVCMCVSWKYLLSIMSLKSRRFSLDSNVCLDGVGVFGVRRGSNRFSSRKSKHSQSLDDARLEIQALNHSLNSSIALRKQTITEESIERSDGLINSSSFLKQNKTFHKLFQEIPEGENLTHTFTCALQKEVLYHGKIFVSENYVCFHSSVLLKETKVVLSACSVSGVKKHNSALSMLSIQTADGEKASSYSSLEDSVDRDLSRQSSICLDNGFPLMPGEGPTRQYSTLNTSTDDDRRLSVSWVSRITERVTPLSFLREGSNASVLAYLCIMLMVLLLLASGYIGLRIMVLEEQLTELTLHHGEGSPRVGCNK